MKKPNILYLHTHDCGRFISPYGYDMPTPHLMKFAKEGTVFRQACCTSPTCSPSRAGLLFGQYGHVNGMMGLAWMGDWYEPKNFNHHLVQFLKKHDYICAMAGVNHISKSLKGKIGYDRVLDLAEPGTLESEADEGVTRDLTQVESIDRFFHEKHEKPFFASVGLDAPHRYGKDRRLFNKKAVYKAPDSEESKYSRPFPIYPDNAISRSETANFKEGAKIMDDKFGAVLNALEHSGHKDDTLVILTTDHGAGTAGMKCTLSDWGIGVFLMMRGPGIPQGEVLDGLVSHVDIYPTLTEYLDVETPDYLQGMSLMPMLRGEKEEVNDFIYAEQGYHGCARPLRAIRSSRYKLIRCFLPESEAYYSSDGGPMFDYWVSQGYDKRMVPEYALYDLMFDPTERCNQANNPDYKEVFDDLKQRLDQFMKETNDPLATGDVPLSPECIAKQNNPSITYDEYLANKP